MNTILVSLGEYLSLWGKTNQLIMYNHTWEIVDLPLSVKTIGCKWIFERKLDPNVSIKEYKAQLVDKWFIERNGVNYLDTFAIVTKISSIRMLITLASTHNLELY